MLFLLGKFPFFDHVTRLFLEILNGKTLSFSLVSPSEKSAKFQLNLLNTLEVIKREVKLVKKKIVWDFRLSKFRMGRIKLHGLVLTIRDLLFLGCS